MTKAIKILALGVALAATATMAKADTLTGYVSFGATSNGYGTFTQSGNILTVDFFGGATTTGGGGPTLNIYNSTAALIENFTVNTSTDAVTVTNPAFQVTEGYGTSTPGPTLQFFATSGSVTDDDGFFDLTLFGYLTDDGGATTTPGDLAFSSQSINILNGAQVAYSGTIYATPTPEPSSLALLGTGLLGAAGIARRRFMSR